jgi:hypothetical protein
MPVVARSTTLPEGGSVSTSPHDEKSVTSVDQSTTVATGNMSANSAYLGSLTTTDATALASAPAPPLSTDCGTYTYGTDFLSELPVSTQ